MKQGFKVMDSDMHVIEPPDLWQRYIEPELKDQAPRGTTKSVADIGLLAPDGTPWGRNPKNVKNLGQWAKGRRYEYNQKRFKPYEDMGWTGDTQLRAMDEEGIDIAVLYPSRGLFALTVPDLEPRLAAAIARAYNNWLYDFCEPNRQRLLGAGMISPFDVNDAVAEARRCVSELGFRGVFLRPNLVHGRNWHDPYYEPLWSTLEELGVPVGFHEGSTSALPHVGEQFGINLMLAHTVSHPVEQILAAVSFCGGGILARHPGLRVAFLEGNSSWVPFFLWRLDEHWERIGDVYAPELTMPPSAYWKRQCFASVEADEELVKYTIDYLGNAKGLVFSTDFPHGDSAFPESIDRFLQVGITKTDKQQILWDNCTAYYGITG
jgi:uncharacterized protein